jgi:arsenate reductase
MTNKIYHVLFLCSGNSARSIFAELLLLRLGLGKFRAFSAGSQPKGKIDPLTLEVAKDNNFLTDELHSKAWSDFSGSKAPQMDYVFTVCDKAAAETCPTWPGQPITAHWGITDPTTVESDHLTKKTVFYTAYRELQNRISIFINLPLDSLDRLKLQKELNKIGGGSSEIALSSKQVTA